jgi:cobalt-zinc-cadmium efflux system outer membrane protein
MHHRSWIVMTSIFFWTPSVLAQGLTLEDVLSAVGNDAIINQARTASVQAETYSAQAQGRWDGPTVRAGLERVADESEWSVTLAQAFELSGKSARQQKAAIARAKAHEAGVEVDSLDQELEAVEAFYEAIHHDQRIALISARAVKLTNAASTIQRRVDAGDASTFELEWIQRELRNAELDLGEANAALELALGVLVSIVAVDASGGVSGNLDVVCSVPEGENTQARVYQRRIDAERTDIEVTQNAWIPGLEVEAGWKAISATNMEQGFIVGLGLSLPLWSAPGAAIDAAEARIVATQAELKVIERTRSHRLNSTRELCEKWVKIGTERETAVRLTQQLSDRASAGYAAGELTLIEWLNAEEGVLNDQMAELESKYQAKRLENLMHRLSGGWQ